MRINFSIVVSTGGEGIVLKNGTKSLQYTFFAFKKCDKKYLKIWLEEMALELKKKPTKKLKVFIPDHILVIVSVV